MLSMAIWIFVFLYPFVFNKLRWAILQKGPKGTKSYSELFSKRDQKLRWAILQNRPKVTVSYSPKGTKSYGESILRKGPSYGEFILERGQVTVSCLRGGPKVTVCFLLETTSITLCFLTFCRNWQVLRSELSAEWGVLRCPSVERVSSPLQEKFHHRQHASKAKLHGFIKARKPKYLFWNILYELQPWRKLLKSPVKTSTEIASENKAQKSLQNESHQSTWVKPQKNFGHHPKPPK